ncbi:MAG: 50S ribosomal protein L25 [Elusimicrobia bacterium HGW-Elusimicrobia-4]|nr:MAG: 50S ribosomal protein L25 [Elusimicrobia bacterium HGW-Elusimicrobia-4]
MEKFSLDSQARKHVSKGEMKKLRTKGLIPAVLYGDTVDNVILTIDAAQFTSLLKRAGHNVIISLNMPDKTSKTVLIKDIQKNVISRELSHIDFYQVSMKKKIEISIPVMLIGEAPGVKSGGVLSHIVRELKVKCLPTDIPEKITVDISKLEIGNTVLVKDLVVPKNVEILIATDQIVANIVSPTILEEVTPVAGAEAAAEPEVIGKGKKEEEGEEGAEATPVAGAKKESAPVKKEEKPKEEKK